MRLHASGVCSDDLNAIDGSVEIPCPVVPGPRGRGRRRGDRRGRARPRARRPRRPLVGAVLRHLRAVPARPAPPVRHGVAADARGRPARRHDAALVRRRDGPPLLLPLVVRRAGGRPRALVRPHPRGGAVRGGGARRLRGHVRRRRRLADGRRAARRARRRLRPGRHRDVGDPRLGGRGRVADRRRRRAPRAGSSARGRRGRRRRSCSTARPRRSRPRSSRPAAAGSTTPSSRAAGRPRCRAAFLSTRARGCGGHDGRAARRCRDLAPRDLDPAHGAARAGLDLRLVAARPRLPRDPEPLPPRPAAARAADLAPHAARRGG